MDKKKSKLTISGIAKKSIESIEKAKTQSKNSVVIEKKQKFSPKSNFSKPSSVRSKPPIKTTRPSIIPKTSTPITNDYERRKLAEQSSTTSPVIPFPISCFKTLSLFFAVKFVPLSREL